VLRRGWPAFASVVLLPKQLEVGRAARLVERLIFLGAVAGFIPLRRIRSMESTVPAP
jgi:hypothetical protein